MNKAILFGGFCRTKNVCIRPTPTARHCRRGGEEVKKSNLQYGEFDNDQVQMGVKVLARR